MLFCQPTWYIRPYLVENTGSRPLSQSQAAKGLISSWVGDDQRIPAVVCFYLFVPLLFVVLVSTANDYVNEICNKDIKKGSHAHIGINERPTTELDITSRNHTTSHTYFALSAFMPFMTQSLASWIFLSISSCDMFASSNAVCLLGTWRPASKPGRSSNL